MCSYMYITTVSYAIWSVTACTLIECTEPAMAFKQVDDYTDIAETLHAVTVLTGLIALCVLPHISV